MTQIQPAARQELEDGAVYYAQISDDLADRFLKDYEQTLSFIEIMPLGWALHYADLRKLNFRIFPYSIIYRFDHKSNDIVVVAIQHQNRKPFYWKGRI